jgi:hypothetical protein
MIFVVALQTFFMEINMRNEFRLKLKMFLICVMPAMQLYWSMFFGAVYGSLEVE